MSERPYITCQELIDFLYLYLEGELPEDRRREFERHLTVCPDCVNYVEQYRETMRLCVGAYADSGSPAPADMPPELVDAILAASRRK